MPRYISEEDFTQGVEGHYCTDCDNYGGVRCRACWIDDAIDLVEKTPTADVVEVVRCKNCKWWEVWITGSTVGRCENPRNGLVNEYSEETDFCSYGERKE